jgi:hypothetical protein
MFTWIETAVAKDANVKFEDPRDKNLGTGDITDPDDVTFISVLNLTDLLELYQVRLSPLRQ